MRFGRNVARSLFEYYRFTNVLCVPMYAQMGSRRTGRPRTHHGRSRNRYISPDMRPRPRTTRAHAPISYTDLCMRSGYESGGDELSSVDGSPARPRGFGARQQGNIYMAQQQQQQQQHAQQYPDQFSLLTIQASKFSQLDFSHGHGAGGGGGGGGATDLRLPRIRFAAGASSFGGAVPNETMSVAVPKPSLSIIDFNQITRGGLERASRRYHRRGGEQTLK